MSRSSAYSFDTIGSAPCDVAPYYKSLIALMQAPGNSLALVDQYFRTAAIGAGLGRWTGSRLAQRIASSSAQLTVDYMAQPLTPLPVPNPQLAEDQVVAVIADATKQAAIAASTENFREYDVSTQNVSAP